ncbi:MAG: hypothetical protein HY253_00015 [Burkholderiales bacterium]|nr:hypothetical protein [Burkholderiales bacterium]
MLIASQTKLKLNRMIVGVLCAILLSSCAVPYRKGSFGIDGYFAELMPDGTTRVSYSISRDGAVNIANIYAAYRATEMAKEGGYNALEIVRTSDYSRNMNTTARCTVRFLNLSEADMQKARDMPNAKSAMDIANRFGQFFPNVYPVDELQKALEKNILREGK